MNFVNGIKVEAFLLSTKRKFDFGITFEIDGLDSELSKPTPIPFGALEMTMSAS